jgi:hypothetical protein
MAHPEVNKPRVFLSHSKKDEDFINKIYQDFRKCQVDPWLDTEEIRDGKSWQNVIFAQGIPTCDAVLAYFTEHSISSKMFGKEIDAALITQLSDEGIAFLPYVLKEELRGRLRSDIQSLHIRVWNNENYQFILPSVVAEIWRSYLERSVRFAVLQEKNKRLELELEVTRFKEKDKSQIFLPSEDADFEYIYRKLNRKVDIEFDIWQKSQDAKGPGRNIGKENFKFNLFELLMSYLEEGFRWIGDFTFKWKVEMLLKCEGYPKKQNDAQTHFGNGNIFTNHLVELRMYGLTETVQKTDATGMVKEEEKFTEKMYRFLYWLEHHNYIPPRVSFDYVGFVNKEI